MEYWIERAGGGKKVELHAGFLELTHCNNRPLVSDAAEEGRMMLLEEVVAMFPREVAGGFSRKTSKSWNAEFEEGKRKRRDSGKPEAGFSFPGRDAGDGEDAGVNLGVEIEEGGKVGRELGDASQVADPGGYALTDEGNNSGPAGEAKDGREESGGFGGDGEGLPLAIFEGSGGAPEDDAAVAFDGQSGEPSGWEDGAGRDEKPTLVNAERDASRSKDADGVGSNEIGYASIDEETGVINKGGDPPPPGGGATTGMVLDSDGESNLNNEKSRLKANGVQEESKYSPACTQWPCGQRAPLGRREESGRRRHTGTNGATTGRTQPDRSR